MTKGKGRCVGEGDEGWEKRLGFKSKWGGGGRPLGAGKGRVRPPLFSLIFFLTGAVRGCSGREAEGVCFFF